MLPDADLKTEEGPLWRCQGTHPGLPTCKASALPPSYIKHIHIAQTDTDNSVVLARGTGVRASGGGQGGGDRERKMGARCSVQMTFSGVVHLKPVWF